MDSRKVTHGHGTVTVEYYDGSSDEFTESDNDSDEINENFSPIASGGSDPYPVAARLSTGSSSLDTEFKTYDFRHPDADREICEAEVEGGNDFLTTVFVSDNVRMAISNSYIVNHQEQMYDILHPKASFQRCPRGGTPESYSRRSYPGPFLTCPLGHECGDEFTRVPIAMKPMPELDLSMRSPHIRERKARFFKQCKSCESIAFAHHRNPVQHYEDYLNNVTYRQHKNHTKVWPQHLADLNFMLGDEGFDAITSEKCKHYKPSQTVITTTSRYAPNPKRRRTAVLAINRRPIVIRGLRRFSKPTTASQMSVPQTDKCKPSLVGSTPSEKQMDSEKETNEVLRPAHFSPKKFRKPQVQVKSELSSASSSEINIPKTAILSHLRTTMTRQMKSRQGSSKISKQFVKKPEPPKEAKYIQKLKPNISAKFLRARSRSKRLSLTSPTKTGKRDSKMMFYRRTGKRSQVEPMPGTSPRNLTKSLTDDSSEDGSYAKFRNEKGEFDSEKYRKCILKMLIRPAKRTRRDRKSQGSSSKALADLKKLKTRNYNGISQAKRKRGKKSKGNSTNQLRDFTKSRHSEKASGSINTRNYTGV